MEFLETLKSKLNNDHLALKDATQVNFSQKTAFFTFLEAILTTRHLSRPKNEVSKLFENLNFYTMFMC